MKIAIVRKEYSLRKGGAERYCVMLVKQLHAMGHELSVVGETIDDELLSEVSFLPVRVNHATSWTKNRSFSENASQVVLRGRFDVTLGLSRTPAVDVFRVTDRLHVHWMSVYYRNHLKQMLQGLNPRHRTILALERAIYQSKRVKRFITESQLDRRLLTHYYGVPEERIRTICNGVDTRIFNPTVRSATGDVRRELGLKHDQPLLVFAAMDFEGKGLRSLFNAVALMRNRNARVLVLGSGKQGRFSRLAKKLDISERVFFLGRRSDIQRYYGAGDLFVLPTIYEPFGLVHLEALACGLPVVTTATAGGADVIEEGVNGYVIPSAHAVDLLRDRMDEHLALPSIRREEMSASCWETAKGMTVERNALETLKVLEEVVSEKP